MEKQKCKRGARVAMSAKQERMERVYPLLMGNDNRFLRVFSLFEYVLKFARASRKRKRAVVKFKIKS